MPKLKDAKADDFVVFLTLDMCFTSSSSDKSTAQTAHKLPKIQWQILTNHTLKKPQKLFPPSLVSLARLSLSRPSLWILQFHHQSLSINTSLKKYLFPGDPAQAHLSFLGS